MEKVYVVHYHYSTDFQISAGILGVFKSKEDAKQCFEKAVAADKECINNCGWVESIEEDCYEAFEDGCYPENHVCTRITEIELK